MSSYNKVILIGNLTKDVELKYTPQGLAIARVSLAVNKKYKDKETTLFIDCDCFKTTAENVSKYCGKGSNVLIEGELKLDTWDDKQTGAKKSVIRVNVNNVQFLSKPKEQKPAQQQAHGDDLSISEENIPF